MRKRGFEPWIAALDAEISWMRWGGLEPSTYKLNSAIMFFLVDLNKGRAPKILNHRGQLILAGGAASIGTTTTSGNGFDLLTERLRHQRMQPLT